MKIDYDSTVNQNIKGQFVQREVKACFSYEMDAVLSASQELNIAQQHNFPTYEEIENFYQDVWEKCGDTRLYNDANGGEQCKCGGDYESQPQEIFEWWIVTDFLYRKLKAHGEPVLEWGDNYYWGRTCCGQAIRLDWVISKICEEMEILSGQKYDWSK